MTFADHDEVRRMGEERRASRAALVPALRERLREALTERYPGCIVQLEHADRVDAGWMRVRWTARRRWPVWLLAYSNATGFDELEALRSLAHAAGLSMEGELPLALRLEYATQAEAARDRASAEYDEHMAFLEQTDATSENA